VAGHSPIDPAPHTVAENKRTGEIFLSFRMKHIAPAVTEFSMGSRNLFIIFSRALPCKNFQRMMLFLKAYRQTHTIWAVDATETQIQWPKKTKRRTIPAK
jgi:hypothetical protein